MFLQLVNCQRGLETEQNLRETWQSKNWEPLV